MYDRLVRALLLSERAKLWDQCENCDVNEATKNIVMMDLAIVQAEAAAGMYRKPVEMLARELHYDALPR